MLEQFNWAGKDKHSQCAHWPLQILEHCLSFMDTLFALVRLLGATQTGHMLSPQLLCHGIISGMWQKYFLGISEDSSSGPYAKTYVRGILLSVGHCGFFLFSATLSTLACRLCQIQFAILAKLLGGLIQPIEQSQQLNTLITETFTFGLLTLQFVFITARCKVRVWSDGHKETPTSF